MLRQFCDAKRSVVAIRSIGWYSIEICNFCKKIEREKLGKKVKWRKKISRSVVVVELVAKVALVVILVSEVALEVVVLKAVKV